VSAEPELGVLVIVPAEGAFSVPSPGGEGQGEGGALLIAPAVAFPPQQQSSPAATNPTAARINLNAHAASFGECWN
jgi:hypothetical protein